MPSTPTWSFPRKAALPSSPTSSFRKGWSNGRTFDQEVFGCSYHGHYETGIVTIVTVNPEKKGHPILTGVPETFDSPSWLYLIAPLAPTAEALMMGKIPGKEAEAVVLTNTYKRGSRIVYTSLGHWDDFKTSAFQRILINSVFWTMKLEVPKG
jgi:type 1 glutamine amidotransferase